MTSLANWLRRDDFQGYAYCYPHKSAYRPFERPVALRDAWRDEDRSALFLYVHLPFCEMRCGFCNLFTTANPEAGLVAKTLSAIRRQSRVTSREIQPAGIGAAAFGGGTPSFLDVGELDRLFDDLSADWPVDWHRIPVSFEVSPGTITREKVRLLLARGVDRLSIGIQSFLPEDLRALGRPHRPGEAEAACRLLRDSGVGSFNIDLIYGADGQTEERWRDSLRAALAYGPDELFLYPLYVRELTGLGRRGDSPAANRRRLYLIGRDLLLQAGYVQQSMRRFHRPRSGTAVDYCCQEDGMVGLGPGARSYTRALHYSSEFAVGRSGVLQIVEGFDGQSDDDFSVAHYGAHLDLAEQRRRYLIKSLLRAEGLTLAAYRSYFGSEATVDFAAEIAELLQLDLASVRDGVLQLSAEGLSRSDSIGPWLYSDAVRARMEAFECV